MSVVGGYCYGVRDWPGSYRAQSLVLLSAEAALVGASGLGAGAGLVALAVPLGIAGAAQAGLLTARNLSLQRQLPPSASTGRTRHHSLTPLGAELLRHAAASTPPDRPR